jgi:DNA-binding PadR family transcriptional regulator
MKPHEHLPLAPRDLLILSVLAERPLHGYGIIKAVETRSRSGVLLDPANLYRVLRRMRKAGWIRDVSGETPEEDAGDGGRRRKTYRITPHGQRILEAELNRLERLLKQARPALAEGERG